MLHKGVSLHPSHAGVDLTSHASAAIPTNAIARPVLALYLPNNGAAAHQRCYYTQIMTSGWLLGRNSTLVLTGLALRSDSAKGTACVFSKIPAAWKASASAVVIRPASISPFKQKNIPEEPWSAGSRRRIMSKRLATRFIYIISRHLWHRCQAGKLGRTVLDVDPAFLIPAFAELRYRLLAHRDVD